MTPKQRTAWLKKMQKESDREKLATLRIELKRARALAKQRRIDARSTCKNAKASVKEWSRLERLRAKDAIELKRLTARQTCDAGRAAVALLIETRAEKTKRLSDLREERRRERIWSSSQRKLAARPRATAKAEERDEVLHNLTPDEQWLYLKVRSRLKPRARMSPTEVFQHWLHEHSGEAMRLLDEHAQDDVRALEEQERAYYERRRAG